MNEAVAHDMNVSTWLFRECVWPLIKDKLGGGELLVTEGTRENSIAYSLDTIACIDALQILPKKGVRGISSRVQTDNIDWGTFTLRQSRVTGARTEMEKINFAIDSKGSWLHPNIHVQAYARSRFGPIISVGCVRTVDLFNFVKGGAYGVNGVHNAGFVYCRWDDLIKSGVRVEVIRPTEEVYYAW